MFLNVYWNEKYKLHSVERFLNCYKNSLPLSQDSRSIEDL